MTDFAETLKTWRRRKRMSQMALADAANVSPRHLSYLETGKSSPSRPMVLRLTDALSVPPHLCNDWLVYAGFAPIYQRRTLDSEALAPFVAAAQRLLDRHHPYPGWALDADWRLSLTNAAGSRLLAHLGLSEGDSLVDALIEEPTLGGRLINWQEAAAHLVHRLRAEGRKRGHAVTSQQAEKLSIVAPDIPTHPSDIAIPTVLEIDGREMVLTSVQASFNTAQDLTLSDLRIELFYPTDEPSEKALSKIVEDRIGDLT
ncbi:MAG: helix-turn-helix domain-containing protein [Pseudomonadota bacterium]